MLTVVIGIGLLFFMYFILVKEYFHRTVAAGLAASVTLAVLIGLGVNDYDEILRGIDVDTIILLMSMMIMVTIMSYSNVFTYLSAWIIRHNIDSPFRLVALLGIVTGVISGFIDNVTTVIIVTPIILDVARRIRIDPRPMLMTVVLESNIGGAATLIGDPPNILIGSATGLGFNDFIVNLGPIVAVDMAVSIILLRIIYRSWFRKLSHRLSRLVVIEEDISIDKRLMAKSLVAFSIAIALFMLEDTLGYPPAIPAVISAGLLLATASREVSIHRALEGVEWTTLVFFIFMFIVIKGVEMLGVMEFIAGAIGGLHMPLYALIVVIVWSSAILSAFIDNIPFVMSMIPVIRRLNAAMGVHTPVLYWALSLGGCLGGNGTLVGASANIVVASLAEKNGYDISFRYFLRIGFPVMTVTVALATLYLLLIY